MENKEYGAVEKTVPRVLQCTATDFVGFLSLYPTLTINAYPFQAPRRADFGEPPQRHRVKRISPNVSRIAHRQACS